MAIVKHKLIGLHNHQIQFGVDDNIYIVPRETFERKFKVYWLRSDLYDVVKVMFNEDRFWFDKFKIS